MSMIKLPLLLASVVLVAAGARAAAAGARGVRPKHVLFLGFDGLCPRQVERAKTPTFDRLRKEGSWSYSSRTILPSSSACNWCSIFTCSASEQTGFVEWNTREPVFPPSETLASGRYPDLFAVLRAQRPRESSVFVYDWVGMPFVIDTNACTVVKRACGVPRMTRRVLELIKEGLPRFAVAVCGEPDDSGHRFGWDSDEYTAVVEEIDTNVGMVLDALKTSGKLDETVLIITSDHGGKGKGHGKPTMEEINRPLFVVGKGVRRGHELKRGGFVYDTGATMGALLGLEFPYCWIGRPIDEAFNDRLNR